MPGKTPATNVYPFSNPITEVVALVLMGVATVVMATVIGFF